MVSSSCDGILWTWVCCTITLVCTACCSGVAGSRNYKLLLDQKKKKHNRSSVNLIKWNCRKKWSKNIRDRSWWLAPRRGHITSEKDTRYLLYRELGRPQGWFVRVRKISPLTEFDPRTAHSIRDTDWATAAKRSAVRYCRSPRMPAHCTPVTLPSVPPSGSGRMVTVVAMRILGTPNHSLQSVGLLQEWLMVQEWWR